MHSSTIKFLTVVFFSFVFFNVFPYYSWQNLHDDIQQMPQCNDSEKKEECQKIKSEIAEFKKAFDSSYGIFYTTPYVKQLYFKEIGAKAFPESFDSEIEEKYVKLFIDKFSRRWSYSEDGEDTRKFLRKFLTYRRMNTISLKEFIAQKLKESKR